MIIFWKYIFSNNQFFLILFDIKKTVILAFLHFFRLSCSQVKHLLEFDSNSSIRLHPWYRTDLYLSLSVSLSRLLSNIFLILAISILVSLICNKFTWYDCFDKIWLLSAKRFDRNGFSCDCCLTIHKRAMRNWMHYQ